MDELAKYERICQVGEGTYGQVYKAKNLESGKYVAMKKILMEKEYEGFPFTAVREIKLLKQIESKFIVELAEIVTCDEHVYLVFEYMEHDLAGLLHHNDIHFDESQIKCIMQQLFRCLEFLHSRSIVHRDIKGSNLLMSSQGILKLADFGLAKSFAPPASDFMTNRVITLWYRPPEILLGSTNYGPEVDIWSAGCILMELITKKPPFNGVDEVSQFEAILKLLGSPEESVIMELDQFCWAKLLLPTEVYPKMLNQKFSEQ